MKSLKLVATLIVLSQLTRSKRRMLLEFRDPNLKLDHFQVKTFKSPLLDLTTLSRKNRSSWPKIGQLFKPDLAILQPNHHNHSEEG